MTIQFTNNHDIHLLEIKVRIFKKGKYTTYQIQYQQLLHR
jgi:hypothetical protein